MQEARAPSWKITDLTETQPAGLDPSASYTNTLDAEFGKYLESLGVNSSTTRENIGDMLGDPEPYTNLVFLDRMCHEAGMFDFYAAERYLLRIPFEKACEAGLLVAMEYLARTFVVVDDELAEWMALERAFLHRRAEVASFLQIR